MLIAAGMPRDFVAILPVYYDLEGEAVGVSRDDLETFGLACVRQDPALMPSPHRHNEVELNFVATGTVTYRFAGSPTVVSAGRLALFWAALPRQLIEIDEGTTMWWLTVPLARFLRWHLPEALTTRVLSGAPLIAGDGAADAADPSLFGRWEADLRAASSERRIVALLEIEARLRRLALALPADDPHAGSHPAIGWAGDGAGRAELLARFIAGHYTEPLTIRTIAAAAGLQPNYAMTLFKRTFGLSIGEYLTRYRVADAQRLLATTDARIVDVALAVGFGSLSRFYVAFSQACGRSPRAYRAHVLQSRDAP